MKKLIDTHAHLNNSCYADDYQQIIDSMDEDGLEKIISVSYDLNASRKNFEIAKSSKNVYFSVGVHPSYSKSFDDTQIDELFKLSQSEKCVAIGEIGLDYHYEDTDKSSQKIALLTQLDLVEKANLPAIFHLRDAYEDMLGIIENNKHKIKQRAVMHCYSGNLDYAKKFLDMGFYISFTGAISYKNSHLPELVKFIPHDRVLIETDCPYLSPMPHRGKTNYPKYVVHVAEKIAESWGRELDYVKEVTTRNAFSLFKKMNKQ
ncbi:MAG: TatD family hydrolase [Firmicutes bacterium]|nr:TatD family hydrolase [Bacillota bacterium]